MGATIGLFILSLKPGGLIPTILLRVSLLGGVIRFLPLVRNWRHERDPQHLSIGCLVPLVATMVVVGLFLGGLAMMAVGAD